MESGATRRTVPTALALAKSPRSPTTSSMMARTTRTRPATMPKTQYHHWRELPYREIWFEDTEFYPGAGLVNGGREGDLPTPICLCAIELRTNRAIRWW